MTTPRKAAPAASGLPAFEDDRFYAVDLARKTVWKGQNLSPAHNPMEFRGDVANALRDDIASAALLPVSASGSDA
jgi:hypothetical protein